MIDEACKQDFTVLVGKVCQLLTLLLRPAWVRQLTMFSAHKITVEMGKG